MARLSIRLTDEQKSRLDSWSAKTGYTPSEIIRFLIDNVNEITLSLALDEIKNNKATEIQKVANEKYNNFLLANLTNNVNQLAKYVNTYEENSDNNFLHDSFLNVVKSCNDIEKKYKEK